MLPIFSLHTKDTDKEGLISHDIIIQDRLEIVGLYYVFFSSFIV